MHKQHPKETRISKAAQKSSVPSNTTSAQSGVLTSTATPAESVGTPADLRVAESSKQKESVQELVGNLLQGLGYSLQQSGKLMKVLDHQSTDASEPSVTSAPEGTKKKVGEQLRGRMLTKPRGILASGARVSVRDSLEVNNYSVALFRDLTAQRSNGNYKATISWGDNTSPEKGTVAKSGELFQVSGSHRYARPGRFKLTVTIESEQRDSAKTTTQAIIGSFNQRFTFYVYGDLLHRHPSLVELKQANASLVKDPSGINLKLSLIETAEYFQKRGEGTNTGFLNALYQDVLGRAATKDEFAGWASKLRTVSGRAVVAREVVESDDAKAYIVNGLIKNYQTAFSPAARRLPQAGNNYFNDFFSPDEEQLVDSLLRFYGVPRTVAFPILWTDYENQYGYDRIFRKENKDPTELTSNPFWPSNKAGGQIFFANDEPKWEWVPVLHPKYPLWEWFSGGTWPDGNPMENWLVGVSGWAGGIKLPTINQDDLNELALLHPEGFDPNTIDPMEILYLHDMPFDHPFGRDFSFGLAPDSQYWPLMSPIDVDLSPSAPWFELEPDTTSALSEVRQTVFNNAETPWTPPGALHVEIEQGLVPPDYWPQGALNGRQMGSKPLPDRVVLFGRWIVDAGHDNFGTEMHPPLLIIKANNTDQDTTQSKIICRPYLTSQIFSWDDANDIHNDSSYFYPLVAETEYPSQNGLRKHFTNALAQVGHALGGGALKLGLGLVFGLPGLIGGGAGDENADSQPLRADPIILPGLAAEDCHVVQYYLRAPSPRRSVNDVLRVSYHFTVHSGITPSVLNVGDDQVQIVVWMCGRPFVPEMTTVVDSYTDSGEPIGVHDEPTGRMILPDPPPGKKSYAYTLDQLLKTLPADQQSTVKQKLFNKIDQDTPGGFGWVADRLKALAQRGAEALLYPREAWPSTQFPAPNATDNVADLRYEDLTPPDIGITVDDSQPYPIYGFVKLYWQRA